MHHRPSEYLTGFTENSLLLCAMTVAYTLYIFLSVIYNNIIEIYSNNFCFFTLLTLLLLSKKLCLINCLTQHQILRSFCTKQINNFLKTDSTEKFFCYMHSIQVALKKTDSKAYIYILCRCVTK